jgi:hypothetical protein
VFKDLVTKKVVHDVKCSWNAETFMSATPDVNYEWQGRIYMELWYADEFHLRYLPGRLSTSPTPKERITQKYKYYSGDMTDAELDLLEKSGTNL